MSRSVNMAIIIGNLTRDPEMRYTSQGHAVTTFGVATNRSWITDGEERENTEFHNVVAWNKLAEICSQLLSKGRKVYVQGRLQTRTWDDEQGQRHWKTEIVADEMIVLDWRGDADVGGGSYGGPSQSRSEPVPEEPEGESVVKKEGKTTRKTEAEEGGKEEAEPKKKKPAKDEKPAEGLEQSRKASAEKGGEDVNPGDMPF